MHNTFAKNFKSGKILFLLGLLLVLCQYSFTQKPIKVALIVGQASHQKHPELTAVYKFLNQHPLYNAEYLSIANAKTLLAQYDMAWFHRPDSSVLSESETSPHFIEGLRTFVSGGKSLFLTLDAARLLVNLGLEKTEPEIRYADAIDSGYGRKLGLHAFREHPVFEGLYGGAYIFSPLNDCRTRVLGFFDKRYPANGSVIAVDWSYITLKQGSKLMAEYLIGKGKVVSLGAYVWLSVPNQNRIHLGKFISNTIKYLTGNPASSTTHFWPEKDAQVMGFGLNATKLNLPTPKNWPALSTGELLERRFATSNLVEVAGKRLFAMGAENGGIEEIWAHPFMAARDYEVGIKFANDDSVYWLNTQRPFIQVTPEAVSREYKFRRAYLNEILVASPSCPHLVLHYEYRGVYPAKLFLRMKSNFRFMWPYDSEVLGTINYFYDKGINSFIAKTSNEEFSVIAGWNKTADSVISGQYETVVINQNPFRIIPKPTEKLQVALFASFSLAMNDKLDVVITASGDGVGKMLEKHCAVMSDPLKIYIDARLHSQQFSDRMFAIKSPDVFFNKGFAWAMKATDKFIVETPGIGTSLVAGYATTRTGWNGNHQINGRPGYAWYFGRDAQWSGLALLGYGDYENVKNILLTFERFQDLSGKIYHELTTSGVVHYDAADATPLYIVLAGRYVRQSGNLDYLKTGWTSIEKAINYCYSTDTDENGLIENTNVGHGWVEGGPLFGSHTSLYLASCWAEALKEAAWMAMRMNKPKLAKTYYKDYQKVINTINQEFWNPTTQVFFHGLMPDGTFHPELSMMPVIPMLFNQITPDKTEKGLQLYAANEFSSNWGVRILSDQNPKFRPAGYHSGSVWPLFTGWTALAEYSNGRPVQGFGHIMNNLGVYDDFSIGYVQEVLNGAAYKPSGVCPHQCWSETMVVQPVIDGMLGFRADAFRKKVMFSPALPAHWDSLEVKNLRIGNQYIHVSMKRINGTTTWNFYKTDNEPLQIEFSNLFPVATKIQSTTLSGKKIKTPIEQVQQGVKPVIRFELRRNAEIVFMHKSGISILSQAYAPLENDTPEGIRIIDNYYDGKEYVVLLQAGAGTEGEIRLWSANPPITHDVSFSRLLGNIYTYQVIFPSASEKYVYKSVRFRLNE